jgi:hypothetical protein
MALERATLTNVSVRPTPPSIAVQFNPTEYGIDHGASFAEVQVPGLAMPLLQFIRGEARLLTLELFLDATDKRESFALEDTVEERLAKLRKFVEIDPELHAPPVCLFQWLKVTFQGVVTSFKAKYTLFDERGKVLRARVTLSMKSYASLEEQLRELKRASPDRTRVRVVREGETLAAIAAEVYGDSRLWRRLAEANAIDRPRFVAPGTPLHVPAL